MSEGHGASAATVNAVRNVSHVILTCFMTAFTVLLGSMMAFLSSVFHHPRFEHLDMLLHGHLETFGAVLAVSGAMMGFAAMRGDGTGHLLAVRVRIVTTMICGLCWSTNAYAQASYITRTEDWPGFVSTLLMSMLFVLHSAACFIYYREIKTDGP